MRYKGRWIALVLALMLMGGMPAGLAGEIRETDAETPADGATLETEAEPAETAGEILVIYPEEADRRGTDDNLSAIAQVLLSLRCTADFIEAGEAAALIGQYEKVIWCATADSSRMRAEMLDGYEGALLVLGSARGLENIGLEVAEGFEGNAMAAAEYAFDDEIPFHHSVQTTDAGQLRDAEEENGTLTGTGGSLPLASGRGRTRYLALTDYTDDFARGVLMQETALWLWPYESRMHTYTMHAVIDAVYPFYEPWRLKTLAEEMAERKMNFVISVMPIYEHSDYPAMTEFCEVLRYAQANGGAVILHAPIVQGTVEKEELAQKLTEAIRCYTAQDVYPLGIEIPSEWIFREDILPILGRYRTLFLSEMDAFAAHSPREYGLKAYLALGSQQIVPALKMDETGISHLARCATAVYLDMSMTEDDRLRDVIEAVRNAPMPMQSLWGMEQAVYGNDGDTLLWDRNTLTVNGEQRFNVYVPRAADDTYNYKRNDYYRFVANLKNQNHFLIGISAAVLAIFLLLGRKSRLQMHKRFLKPKTESAVPDEMTDQVQ